jgi:hypothetical protein
MKDLTTQCCRAQQFNSFSLSYLSLANPAINIHVNVHTHNHFYLMCECLKTVPSFSGSSTTRTLVSGFRFRFELGVAVVAWPPRRSMVARVVIDRKESGVVWERNLR